MSLGNLVLRKVMKETTALGVWKALERDYQTKTLPNRIYMKQRFASFKMDDHKSIEENLDTFLKLVSDLSSLNINISDEDQAIQVLSSLPQQYDSLVDTLCRTAKETLTMNDVINSAYSKEVELKEKRLLNKSRSGEEGLYVESRGRSEKRVIEENLTAGADLSQGKGSIKTIQVVLSVEKDTGKENVLKGDIENLQTLRRSRSNR